MTRKKPLPIPTTRRARPGRCQDFRSDGDVVAQIASNGIGVFDPAYYGLPDDELLLKPEHRK